MANTYQDLTGKSYSTRQEALAGNRAVGFDPTTYRNFKTANPTLTPDAQDFSTSPASPKPITPASFNPVAPIKVNPPTPTTQGDGLATSIAESATQSADQMLRDEKAKAEAAKNSSQNDYLKGVLGAEGTAGAESRLYEQKGVNSTEADLKDINNQILAEQKATDNQIAELKKNANGLFGGALEQQIQKVKDESLSRQADLAIKQMMYQGKYDSAKAIADRAVKALTEKETRTNEALKTIYEDNKDTFTTAEQRVFEAAQKARDQEAQNKEYRLRAEFDQKIKQSDPKYQAELKKTLSEIDAGNVNITNPTAGRYAGALQIILGSGKFTKDQKASLITSINSGEDPFTVVKNQAKNLLGQTGDTKLTSYEVARDQLAEVEKSLKAYYAAGGKTDIFKGNFEKALNNLGSVKDPALVQIATEIAASLQIYRNAVSGTAYSVQEGQDIATIFPGINKTEGLNKAILAGRSKAFESTIDSTYRSVLGSAYDELKNAENAGAKAGLSDKDFVESSLKSIGAKYDEVLAKTPPGQKAVIDNKTGQVGYITPQEYDPSLYTPL